MSIIVKGMKMPELYETYKVYFAKTNDGKIVMGMCPLNETGYRPVGEVVALPDKHGRLGDLNELIHELNNSHYPGAPYVYAGISIAIGKVCEAPTIVEAEGEG